MNREEVNKKVDVTAMYFSGSALKVFPKRIELEGASYTFLNSGFQFLVKQGQKIISIFDMTDGSANYRLKFDPDEVDWTLVAITRSF